MGRGKKIKTVEKRREGEKERGRKGKKKI